MWLFEMSDTTCTFYRRHVEVNHTALENKALEVTLTCAFIEAQEFIIQLTTPKQALHDLKEKIISCQNSTSFSCLVDYFPLTPTLTVRLSAPKEPQKIIQTFNHYLSIIEAYLLHSVKQSSACKEEMLLGFYQSRNCLNLPNMQLLSLLSLCMLRVFPSNEAEKKYKHALYNGASQLEEEKSKDLRFFHLPPLLKKKISILKFNNLI